MKLQVKDLLFAYQFSAEKHKKQRRKGRGDIPYINHPIAVVNLLAGTVGTEDLTLLTAALLHDVLEDTNTEEAEIAGYFGNAVLDVVKEVTDNTKLPKKQRKALQIENAPSLSDRAKLIKIADKTCNIADMLETHFVWTGTQKMEYISWSKKLVSHCRGLNENLDKQFDAVCRYSETVPGKIE